MKGEGEEGGGEGREGEGGEGGGRGRGEGGFMIYGLHLRP